MAYTLHHRPAFAIGIEADRQTCDLWHRLCEMTEEEIRDFPLPVVGQRTTDRWVIQAAQSNWAAKAHSRLVNPFIVRHFEQMRRFVTLPHHGYARRNVIYRLGDYTEAPDIEATWFIDPPYQDVRDGYRHCDIDYEALAEWCLSRQGQVIICEGSAGSWLPFKHHKAMPGLPTFGMTPKPSIERVLVHRTHARCAQCSTTFPATRSDARYCSTRCRVRASRAHARADTK